MQATPQIHPGTGTPAVLRHPHTGELWLNPHKADEAWCWLVATPDSKTTLSCVIPANSQLQVGATPEPEDGAAGDMEILKLMATSTGRFAARILDPFLNRWYSNQPITANLLFGSGDLPSVLYETLYLAASSTLAIQLLDLSAAENTVKMSFAGRRFTGCGDRESLWRAFTARKTHPYWLTFDQGPRQVVAAGTTSRFTMTVPQNFDFEAWTIMDDTTHADEPGNFVSYGVRVIEGGSARSLTGAQPGVTVPIELVAAKTRAVTGVASNRLRGASLPFVMNFAHLFQRGTQIQIDVQNTNAFSINCSLAVHGRALCMPTCSPDGEYLLEPVVGKIVAPEVLGAR